MSTTTIQLSRIDTESDIQEVHEVHTEEDRMVSRPTGGQMQKLPECFKSATQEILFVVAVSFTQLLLQGPIGFISSNILRLQEKLLIPDSQLAWLFGSFSLAHGASFTILGAISDRVGHKKLVMAGLLGHSATLIAAGLIQNRNAFFVFRALSGVFCAGMISGSLGLLGAIYSPGKRKNRAFAAFATAPPLGFAIGTLFGGLLTQHLFIIFCIYGGICIAIGCASYFIIPKITFSPRTPERFDFLGSVVAITAVALTTFGLTQGPSSGWAPYTYVLLIVGVLCLPAFLYIERHVHSPIVPPQSWTTPGFNVLLLCMFLAYGSYFCWNYYVSVYWLRVQHATPLAVGAYWVANGITGAFCTLLVGLILHLCPGHWVFGISIVAFAVGPLFFAVQPVHLTYFAMGLPAIIISTFGPDLSFAAASVFLTSNVPRALQASAGSLLLTVMYLGGAIFVGIGGIIETSLRGKGELDALRAIFWFNMAVDLLALLVAVVWLRIPKTEEKQHVE